MTEIYIQRVYEINANRAGFRVLIDKLWPRGIAKEKLHYDLWAKELTPSTPLRQWFHQAEEAHWAEFNQKYREELEHNPAVDTFIRRIKSMPTVILLYASKNMANNHALILRDFLKERLQSPEK